MNRMRLLLLTILVAAGLISLPSCISDAVTTSSSDILTFSRDTVSFDTVFTDLGTPTARLVVFNNASKGLSISSIRFARPDTEFSLNVDGVSGTEFRDIDILARDSIYIFIECLIPEDASNEPRLVTDDLLFVTNGVTQRVCLEAWGENVTRLKGVTLTEDMHLTADRPYIVFDSLVVAPATTLYADPGTRILFHDGARLDVKGRMELRGAPGKFIHLRGDRIDNVLPDVAYDIMAGQWRGVRIHPESFDNVMEYVDMRSTVNGLVADSCGVLDRPKLTLRNSWLHNSQNSVLDARYSRVEATGCCFSEAAMAVVALSGGVHSFLQTTIANNYLFSVIMQPLLTLSHCLPKELEADPDNTAPLMQASFENCIIYGLADDINTPSLEGSDVFFRYVSFKSEGSDDDNFLNCLWDTDPLFLTRRSEYIFDYRLEEESPVKAAGNPAFLTPESLFDMDGVDRLSSGDPSLGAYQYTPTDPAQRPRR